MSRTHVFLRCMHPNLEDARKDIKDYPAEVVGRENGHIIKPGLREIKVGEPVS
jgi:hypothetical protein